MPKEIDDIFDQIFPSAAPGNQGIDQIFDQIFLGQEPTGVLSQAPQDDRSTLIQIQDLRLRQARGEPGLEGQIQQLTNSLTPETRQTIPGLEPETVSQTGAQAVELGEPTSVNLPVPGLAGGFGESLIEGVPSAARGFQQGLQNVGTGLLTAGAKTGEALGLDTGDFQRDLELSRNIEQARTNVQTSEAPIAGFAGEVAGEIAALPLPGAQAATAPIRIAQTAGLGAATSAVSALGKGDDPIKAALMGAGFGAGLGALTESGLAIARKIANAKKGKFKSDDIDELVKIGKENNIPVFVDDVSTDPFTRQVGTLAENIPVAGTAGRREAQNIAQRKAAEKFRDNLGGDISDVAGSIQDGLQNKLSKLKKIVGKKFDKVEQKLNPLGQIPRNNYFQQIDDELIQLQQLAPTDANRSLANLLNQFKNAPEGNFSVIRRQRSDLGDEIARFYRGDNAAIGQKGADRLQRVKKALEDDIELFTEKSPEALKAFRQANKFTQEKLMPFKQSQLARLVKTEEPESIIAHLKQFRKEGGRDSRAQKIFNSMDTKGKQAVRFALVDGAFREATKNPNAFSAAKFANELKSLENVTGIFFKGQQKQRLDGLVKLMDATQRAGQTLENPPTGLRLLLPGAIGGIAVGSPATAAGIGGFGLASKALLQTEAGRAILLGLNKATPGSLRFQNLLDKANNLLIRSVSTGSTENRSNFNE